MIRRFRFFLIAAVAGLSLPVLALATDLGNARLISVTPVDGGCVSGPAGPSVQSWAVEVGKTYTITLSNVTDCGNGGTDATINVRVKNAAAGNTDIVATKVVDGTYQFTFTVPATAACTLPIIYCNVFGMPDGPGMFARRGDGGAFQSHLQAATFGPGCTNPQEVIGPGCDVTPARPFSWGRVKQLYR